MSADNDEEHGWKRWRLGRQLTDLDEWPQDQAKAENITVSRLNWSVNWHTLAHRQATRWYNSLKVVQIVAAAAIPVIAAIGGSSTAARGWTAGLGALIVVLEGIQQLKKYAQNALLWGQGKEALKHEYYLYEARAEPYGKSNRDKLLAIRVEQIIGKEVAKWAEDKSSADGHDDQPADRHDGPARRQTRRPARGRVRWLIHRGG